MSETIGSKVKELRKALGLTQEGLSPILGLSPSYISELESDKKEFSRNAISKYIEASKGTDVNLRFEDFFQ